MSYNGFLYGANGQQIFPTPRESPGRYRLRPPINREIKRNISQYDHAELVSESTKICCRIPALRAAIRDKNSWAFSNWLPVYHGENEAWGEQVEEWLMHEVLPNAVFGELRKDFAWGLRVSGMGLDMHGDDLAIFTEDEQHNPKIKFVAAPMIGSGGVGSAWASVTMFGGSFSAYRADGMGVVQDGEYKGCPIYNGVIRRNGQPVAVRILGFNDLGEPTFNDLAIGFAAGTHYACEMEFFGQGRGIPRPADAILHWMNKEEIDDQLLKGLKNAAERTVIRRLPPGMDAQMSQGNAIQMTGTETVNVVDPSGNATTEERAVFVERSQDGTVSYIRADEELTGLQYENPSDQVENFAVRMMLEGLASFGWSYALIDSSSTSRAPTRLETSKANNSISERQSSQEPRTIQFIQYAVALGMKHGRIPRNDAGRDAYMWGIGFPAQMSVDAGNDVTASLNRLKMGLTNERIEAAKDGFDNRKIRRQRVKEVKSLMAAADDVYKVVQGMGHATFTYEQCMNLIQCFNPNPVAPTQQQPTEQTPAKTEKTATP